MGGGYFNDQRGSAAKQQLMGMRKSTRSVHLQLTTLANVPNLAVQQRAIDTNPILGRRGTPTR